MIKQQLHTLTDLFTPVSLYLFSSLKTMETVEVCKTHTCSLFTKFLEFNQLNQTTSAFVYKPIRLSIKTGEKLVLEMSGSWKLCHFVNICTCSLFYSSYWQWKQLKPWISALHISDTKVKRHKPICHWNTNFSFQTRKNLSKFLNSAVSSVKAEI